MTSNGASGKATPSPRNSGCGGNFPWVLLPCTWTVCVCLKLQPRMPQLLPPVSHPWQKGGMCAFMETLCLSSCAPCAMLCPFAGQCTLRQLSSSSKNLEKGFSPGRRCSWPSSSCPRTPGLQGDTGTHVWSHRCRATHIHQNVQQYSLPLVWFSLPQGLKVRQIYYRRN